MRLATALLTIALCGLPEALAAQSDPWQPFLGTWRGPGTAMGNPAVGNAAWERVLGGRFVRLEMSFSVGGASSPGFRGLAYYGVADTTGVWLDSQGNRYALWHRIAGDTLTVRWTMANGAQAQSRYVRHADGTLWERSIMVGQSGRETVFLEYTFSRQP